MVHTRAAAHTWRRTHVALQVFTHLPSNVLMLLVPLMPSLESATAMVFARYSISQVCAGAAGRVWVRLRG